MLVRISFFIAVLLSGGLPADRALADKRVALVIGNSGYKSVPKLANPENDAAAIGLLLRKAGFDAVDVRQNLDTLRCAAPCGISPKALGTPTSRSCSSPAMASRSAARIFWFRSTRR